MSFGFGIKSAMYNVPDISGLAATVLSNISDKIDVMIQTQIAAALANTTQSFQLLSTPPPLPPMISDSSIQTLTVDGTTYLDSSAGAFNVLLPNINADGSVLLAGTTKIVQLKNTSGGDVSIILGTNAGASLLSPGSPAQIFVYDGHVWTPTSLTSLYPTNNCVKLTPPSNYTNFGYSVALSDNGLVLAVGAPGITGSNIGNANIYSRPNASSNVWSLVYNYSNSPGSFGSFVDLSGFSNDSYSTQSMIAIGAPTGNTGNNGLVYVYDVYQGASPNPTSVLTGPGNFGYYLSFGIQSGLTSPYSRSREFDTLLVGNPTNNTVNNYYLAPSSYILAQTLTGPPSFGYSVAGSKGQLMVVGIPSTGTGGAVSIFNANTSQDIPQTTPGYIAIVPFYTLEQTVIGADSTGASLQGSSVAISNDGSTVAFGGPGDAGGIGASWIFQRTNQSIASPWTQQGRKLVGVPYSGTNINQGYDTVISGDGNTLAIDGPLSGGGTGAAWIFQRPRGGTQFTEVSELVPPLSGSGSEIGAGEFGFSFDFDSTGRTIAVGAPLDNNGVGAVWIFS